MTEGQQHSPGSSATPESNSAPVAALSAADARTFVEHLATVASSQAPLAPALRAAADEIPQRRLSQAMQRLAGELEAGRSFEDILANNPRFLPPHMQRLIETGVRSGNLPEVLVQLIDIERTSADLQRSVRLAIAYPIALLVVWTGLLAFFAGYVVPDLIRIMNDLKVELPLSTKLLQLISGKWMLRLLGFLAAAIPMLIVSFRILRRPMGWNRMLTEVPLVGPTLLWRGVASWSRLLSLLLKEGLPLPEALRVASNGIHAPLMVSAGLRAARSVEAGRNLSDALGSTRLLPASLIPLISWGEKHNALPEALKTAAEMFERRVQLRAALLQNVLPPLAFIFTALGTLWLANSIILPMLMLIRSLSSGGGRKKGGGVGGPLNAIDWEERAMLAIGILFAVWIGVTIFLWIARSALGGFLLALTNSRSTRAPSWLSTLLAFFRACYWILTLLALLVIMTTLAGYLGFVLWLASLAIVVMIFVRYREMERRSLLWLLGAAMDKGIPLASAAHAFADERNDRLGRKTRRLAIALQSGASLDKAIASSGNRLPNDALVAVRSSSGRVSAMLKSVMESAAIIDSGSHAAVSRITYLAFFSLFAGGMLAFMCMRVIPWYQRIFADFKTSLPQTTIAVMSAAYFVGSSPIFIGTFLVGTLSVLCYSVGRYTGILRWDAPLVRRFTITLDQALILRALAQAVAQQQPLGGAVAQLAQQYPKSHVRRRLWKAAGRIGQGLHWAESLTATGLLTAADANVLKAAERVGNLAWAMNETADRLSRRFTSRLTNISALVFPAVLLFFGGSVFFIAVGMISPLSKLITSLTSAR